MPFGLKNVGATYQISMVSVFYDMIHESVEVYVDDILSISITKYNHISYLRKNFQMMREYKLKLKPQKCAFAVSSGKLHGFIIISRRGMEVNPKKFLSIVDFPPPKNLKELISIQVKVQSVRRFIA